MIVEGGSRAGALDLAAHLTRNDYQQMEVLESAIGFDNTHESQVQSIRESLEHFQYMTQLHCTRQNFTTKLRDTAIFP